MTVARMSSPRRGILGGRYAVSWPVIGLYAIPSSWIMVFFDQTRLGGDPVLWVLLAAVAYAATVLPLFLARLTVLPTTERLARPIWALIVFIVAAYTRSAVAVPLALSWGLVPESEATYRFLTAPLNVVFWMVLINLLVTQTLGHRDRVLSLSAERTLLNESEASVVRTAQRYRSSLQTLVMRELEPSLQQLLRSWKSNVGERKARQALAQLSHQLEDVLDSLRATPGHSDPVPLPPPTFSAAPHPFRKRLRSRSFRSGGTGSSGKRNPPQRRTPWAVGTLFAPTLVSVVVLYSAFIPTLALLGWQTTFLVVVPAVGVLWGGSALARSALAGLRLGIVPAVTTVLLVYGALGLVSWPLQALVFPAPSWRLQLEFTATVLAVAGLSLAYRVIVTQRVTVENELREVNDNLQRVVAQMRQALWVERHKVATVLHGSVQAAVQVAAMRFARNENPDSGYIEAVQSEIAEALGEIENPDWLTREDFLAAVAAMEALWGTTCLLDINVDPTFLDQLPQESAAARCALEVLREAMLNALKHGEANVLAADLAVTPDRFAEISVTNNGRPPAFPTSAGFGSEILDEICQSWSLVVIDGDVLFQARIVLSSRS